MAKLLRIVIILHMISTLIGEKKFKSTNNKPPIYQIHQSPQLPSDVQVSTFLLKGETKRFWYASAVDQGALSATIVTCSAAVRWSIVFGNATTNATIQMTPAAAMETHHVAPVRQGIYWVQVAAVDGNALLHIYISTEAGGPQALQNAKYQKLRLLKRQRRKRLTIKWTPSLVDPQGTDYCLVVSPKHSYNTLCAAQPSLPHLPHGDEPQVHCMGRRTHYTLTDLHQGQTYHFNLFAINRQSNFTYAYGTASTVFDGHFRPTTLKDGKATFANLKKLDGKAVFRFKVGKKGAKSLDLFIMPCGGAVDVEVTLKDSTVIPPKRIEGFGKISLENPAKAARYYIKIFAMNREELKKTSGVEIYATTRSLARIPLPNMPQEMRVQEYEGLRTCDSVTVGWLAAPVQKSVMYCLVVKEGRIHETEDYRMPNQCGLENRLKKSADFAVQYCEENKYDKEKVVVRKVNQLKAGKSYIVQVTVKKPKGKTLSYDLLQVYTKPSCNKHF